jgi:hypothetical protein
MDEVSSLGRLDLPFVLRRGRPIDCSASKYATRILPLRVQAEFCYPAFGRVAIEVNFYEISVVVKVAKILKPITPIYKNLWRLVVFAFFYRIYEQARTKDNFRHQEFSRFIESKSFVPSGLHIVGDGGSIDLFAVVKELKGAAGKLLAPFLSASTENKPG